ncbi:GDSL-type esterase/lipase family protein [Sphingopyxis granuli]|uniref:GDSL-type esterase/lipase family protein n=1 Tax=Sphingopyxis granuli TaxID=267128 RepID=UPI00301BCD9C
MTEDMLQYLLRRRSGSINPREEAIAQSKKFAAAGLLATAALFLGTVPAVAAEDVATYLAPQSDVTEPYPGMDLSVGVTEFRDQTIRQLARISIGGEGLKVKFSNEYGTAPITLDAVSLAQSLGAGSIDPASSKAVTFGGRTSVTIAPGKTVTSDIVKIVAKPLGEYAVSIYMKQAPVRTAHRFSRTITYVAAGDVTASGAMPEGKKLSANFFMPEIVAVRQAPARVIVAFGDSITDYSPIPNGHLSWPDQLAELVNGRPDDVAVVNAGIGGNRWVTSNMGPCGLCRIERDILAIEGATDVVMVLGINDIGLGYRYTNGFKDASQNVSSKQIIASMQAAIDKAKAKGLKVYVATLVPFKSGVADYYTTGQPDQIPFGATEPHNGEKIRAEVNAYIRQNKTIDGVIDLDRALADPADPLLQLKELTLDGLHPNAAGLGVISRLAYQAIFSGGSTSGR